MRTKTRLEAKLNKIMPAKRLQLLSAFLILISFAVFMIWSLKDPGFKFGNIFFWRP